MSERAGKKLGDAWKNLERVRRNAKHAADTLAAAEREVLLLAKEVFEENVGQSLGDDSVVIFSSETLTGDRLAIYKGEGGETNVAPTVWVHCGVPVKGREMTLTISQDPFGNKVAKLVEWAESLGLEALDLDEAVIDAKLSEASGINNEGLRSQMGYLLEYCGYSEDVKDYVESCNGREEEEGEK